MKGADRPREALDAGREAWEDEQKKLDEMDRRADQNKAIEAAILWFGKRTPRMHDEGCAFEDSEGACSCGFRSVMTGLRLLAAPPQAPQPEPDIKAMMAQARKNVQPLIDAARRNEVPHANQVVLACLFAETRRELAEMRAQAPQEGRKPEWIVNDNAELGVKVGDRFFFMYKGRSLEYHDGKHDDGSPMMWRPIGKREFGECCHPVNYEDPRKWGTVSLDDSDEWMPLPAAPIAAAPKE